MAGIYYPQACIVLKILWEDFQIKSDARLARETTLNILAKSVRVNINDYSHADSFEAEIDYKSFPFDPRLIRSCGVTVHMENMERLYSNNDNLLRIQPKTSNAIFQGFADDDSITFDDNSRTVKLEGRDFTSLFLDRTYPKGTINLEQRIDQVIQEIMSSLPENANNKITLVNKVTEQTKEELPILSSFFGEKDKTSGKKNVKKDESYWECIQDICSRAGLICYMELDKLIINKPRVLYEKKNTTYFVYGKNLKSLDFKRKLGRRKNFNIVVRSLNVEDKEVLQAQIPAEATAEWSNAVGVPNKEVKQEKIGADGKPITEENAQAAPYMAFSVPNIKNKDHLIQVGQEIYEEIGRQEIEGNLETRDMETWKFDAEKKRVNNGCFDLLKLRVGNPLSIEIDASDMQVLSRLGDVDERRRYLIRQCYDQVSADVIARSLSRISTPFYTKSVEYTMSIDSGFSMKVEFINFIETANKGLAK
jgi:hypothetical protein